MGKTVSKFLGRAVRLRKHIGYLLTKVLSFESKSVLLSPILQKIGHNASIHAVARIARVQSISNAFL